jgi:hypothetical protein
MQLRGLVLWFGALFLLSAAFRVCAAEPKESLPQKAKAILEKADRIEIYAIDPEPDKKPEKNLREWRILGKVTLGDEKSRSQVLSLLEESVGRGETQRCFLPRHAIRATRAGKTVDLIICFECEWIRVYYDDEKKPAADLPINQSPRSQLNKTLKAGGVPLRPDMADK